MEKEHTLIGYTKNKAIYPLALWDGVALKKSQQGFSDQSVLSIKSNQRIKLKSVAPHRDFHTDACVYHSEITERLAEFELVASKKQNFVFPIPQKAKEEFAKARGNCVGQGDDEPQKCVFPELIAVSDLDKNGRFEFWYRQPYLWDNGVSVAVIDDSNKLTVIAQDCSDCSD